MEFLDENDSTYKLELLLTNNWIIMIKVSGFFYRFFYPIIY